MLSFVLASSTASLSASNGLNSGLRVERPAMRYGALRPTSVATRCQSVEGAMPGVGQDKTHDTQEGDKGIRPLNLTQGEDRFAELLDPDAPSGVGQPPSVTVHKGHPITL